MPMRGELPPPKQSASGAAAERTAWALIAFCAIGLAAAIGFAICADAFDPSALTTQNSPG
jgi:hypothetical protein